MNVLIRPLCSIIIVVSCAACAFSKLQASEPQPPVDVQALEEWQDMKFGLFVHWGLYSKTAGYWKGQRAKSSGHIMLYEKISVAEWGALSQDFNPTLFDADAWVLAAKNAGMKYIVITSKHHDGLAMYDSPSSDYDLVDKSPFKRDPLNELAEACHKHGIKLGFYYSLGRDWQDPDCPTKNSARSNTWDYPDEDAKVFNKYFNRKARPQVEELVTRYGDVSILWFDTSGLISREESQELRHLIHEHQPKCIINSRIGNNLGDYKVREQKIGDSYNKPWESCVTMARHWNYDLDEKDDYKSPELLVHQLLEIISKGGNYLLNVGPKADGAMTEESLVRLQAIGEWIQINGEGVYGTRPWQINSEALGHDVEREYGDTKVDEAMKDSVNDATSKQIPSEVRFTCKGNTIYAFVCRWEQDDICIKSLSSNTATIDDIKLLGSDEDINWKQSDRGLTMTIPKSTAAEKISIKGFKIIRKQ